MFKKIPYGVKVRVRGSDESGYAAEYAICCSRFFPFMDTWTLIRHYAPGSYTAIDTFPTLEAAQKAAMEQYDQWIDFYERKKKEKMLKKKLSRFSTVWKHP